MALNAEITPGALSAVNSARASLNIAPGHYLGQYGPMTANEFVGTAVLMALEQFQADHTFEARFRERMSRYKSASKLVA